jgi:predicted ATPase/class 3 adenylate cyclase
MLLGVVRSLDQPSGTVTLLFTDVEGSTRLWERHPQAMQTALETHDRLLNEAIEAHSGYVFYTGGDSFGSAFAGPNDALEAAIEIQRRLQRTAWPEETGELRVRMALHTGDPETRDGDYFGPPVNRVARLLSAGHGGQVILSMATHQLVRHGLPHGVGLTDLGQHRLKDLSLPETVFQVTGPELRSDFPPLVTLDTLRTNLPSQATAFIGRRQEVSTLAEMMGRADVRLVTLTGPGGIGKTRLSLQVAADLLEDFDDGVFFVELAPIASSDRVASTIASTLGVSEAADEPLLETLLRSLQRKRMLVVIDNFEHVVDAAPVVGELLAGVPGLKVMTSSREPLRLYGEHEYPVPAMGLPDGDAQASPATIAQSEAVSLFVQRARAMRPDFEIGEGNVLAIAEICRRLQGLPLAIELAAARVRLFDPRTLLERLADSLKTLTGGARDVPHRHQTIRNTIEWSYGLLDSEEQALFDRLGVFHGGRTIEAAEIICGPGLGIDVVDGLESLVAKSLLRTEPGVRGEPRFVMLETIHAFASERLEATGRAEELRSRHARYFAELAEEASSRLSGHDQGVWLSRLSADYENLVTAMEWAFGGGDLDIGLRLVAALGGYWRWKANHVQARLWLDRALVFVDRAPDQVRLQLHIHDGFVAHILEDGVRARRSYEAALEIARRLGDDSAVAKNLISLGLVTADPSDVNLDVVEEGLALARAIGDLSEVAHGLNVLGEIHRLQGNFSAAKQAYEEALSITRATGHRLRETMLLANLGMVAFNLGEPDEAESLVRESYALALEIGDDFITAEGLVLAGGIIGVNGDPERGVRLMAAGTARQAAIGSKTQPADMPELDRLVALIRAQIDDETFDRLWEEGEALTFEQAIELRMRED